MNEFNQCQTQLKDLYRQLNPNYDADHSTEPGPFAEWTKEKPNVVGNPTEFLAYRILYYVIARSAGS